MAKSRISGHGNPPFGGGGGALTEFVERSVTSAELLTLFTTPIILVPAQIGTVWLPVNAIVVYKRGSRSYTGGGGVQVGWPNWTIIGWNGLIQAATSSLDANGANAPGTSTFAQGVNQPLQLMMGTANPAAGDGTIDVTVWYYEVPI